MGIVPVFWFVPSVCVIYPEAIVASFLYLVGYRAHSGAIVAMYISGLCVHKTEAGTSPSSLCRPSSLFS